MSGSSTSTLPRETSSLAASSEPRPSLAELDASCRGPLLTLFLAAVIWLVVGLFLGLLASIKLHGPGFLGDTAWLTLGRIRPAGINAILYGFASQAGLGIAIWMLCRLGATPLCCQGAIIFSTLFWNFGLLLGVAGILGGGSTGFEWLELPRYASPILFAAYSVIALGALITFHYRRERSVYVSQAYLVAALFWFPWIYSAANLLLVFRPVRGAMQVLVASWFANNLLELWLTPLGLAAIFYFIPKLTGRPLYSRGLASFGFWTLAIFGSWTGLARLAGGPIPAWMISASMAANLIMLVPLLSVGLNWYLTLSGKGPNLKQDGVMRFIRFAAVAYLLSGTGRVLIGWREVGVVTQFTYVPVALQWLSLLGFVGMAAFGGIYYIVPRLTRVEWPSASKIRWHYLCSAAGVTLLVGSLAVAGVMQGLKLNLDTVDFVGAMRSIVPLVGLSTMGLLLLLIGQILWLVNLVGLIHLHSAAWRKSVCDVLCEGKASPSGGSR